jgi:hypothetical protein
MKMVNGMVVWGQAVIGDRAQYIATPLVDGVASPPVVGQPVFLLPVPQAGVVKRKQQSKPMPMHATSICANCHTTQTTLWRRNPSGEPECK